MSIISITDRDDYLLCEKCDEVIDGEFDPASRVLELKSPKCDAHVKAKLYFGGTIICGKRKRARKSMRKLYADCRHCRNRRKIWLSFGKSGQQK
jgi:hypothetical protein